MGATLEAPHPLYPLYPFIEGTHMLADTAERDIAERERKKEREKEREERLTERRGETERGNRQQRKITEAHLIMSRKGGAVMQSLELSSISHYDDDEFSYDLHDSDGVGLDGIKGGSGAYGVNMFVKSARTTKRRKILFYGGIAGAVLIILIFLIVSSTGGKKTETKIESSVPLDLNASATIPSTLSRTISSPSTAPNQFRNISEAVISNPELEAFIQALVFSGILESYSSDYVIGTLLVVSSLSYVRLEYF